MEKKNVIVISAFCLAAIALSPPIFAEGKGVVISTIDMKVSGHMTHTTVTRYYEDRMFTIHVRGGKVTGGTFSDGSKMGYDGAAVYMPVDDEAGHGFWVSPEKIVTGPQYGIEGLEFVPDYDGEKERSIEDRFGAGIKQSPNGQQVTDFDVLVGTMNDITEGSITDGSGGSIRTEENGVGYVYDLNIGGGAGRDPRGSDSARQTTDRTRDARAEQAADRERAQDARTAAADRTGADGRTTARDRQDDRRGDRAEGGKTGILERAREAASAIIDRMTGGQRGRDQNPDRGNNARDDRGGAAPDRGARAGAGSGATGAGASHGRDSTAIPGGMNRGERPGRGETGRTGSGAGQSADGGSAAQAGGSGSGAPAVVAQHDGGAAATPAAAAGSGSAAGSTPQATEGGFVWHQISTTQNADGSATHIGYLENTSDGTMHREVLTGSGANYTDQDGTPFVAQDANGNPRTDESCNGNCSFGEGTVMTPLPADNDTPSTSGTSADNSGGSGSDDTDVDDGDDGDDDSAGFVRSDGDQSPQPGMHSGTVVMRGRGDPCSNDGCTNTGKDDGVGRFIRILTQKELDNIDNRDDGGSGGAGGKTDKVQQAPKVVTEEQRTGQACKNDGCAGAGNSDYVGQRVHSGTTPNSGTNPRAEVNTKKDEPKKTVQSKVSEQSKQSASSKESAPKKGVENKNKGSVKK